MKRLIGLIAVLTMLPLSAWSAPTIGTPSGTWANGNTVNIQGSGFGATGPTVIGFDDFESGTSGATISTSGTMYNSLEGTPTYSTNYAFSGSKAFRANMATTQQNAHIPLPAGTSKAWISYNSLIPTGQNMPGQGGGTINWKVIWFLDSNFSTSASPNKYFAFTGYTNNLLMGSNTPDQSTPGSRYVSDFDYLKGGWNHFATYLNARTSGGQIYAAAANASYPLSQMAASGATSSTNNAIRYIGLNSYGYSDSNSNVYIDDVYVAVGDGALARVEIGDASTYTACRKLATMVPTSWSDTSVAVTVRPGNFASGSTAYLYVTDAAGSTSAARAITIGTTTADTTPPTVTSVAVNGSTATINFSETVVTTGYDAADFNLDCNAAGQNISLTNPSGTGTTRTFTIATAIGYGDVCNLDYVGSTNDIEDAAGNDMAAFVDRAVVNNTPLSISGVCGTAEGVSTPTAPTANLCSTGTPGAVTLSGSNFVWICYGSGAGSNSSCSAPFNEPPNVTGDIYPYMSPDGHFYGVP